MPDGRPLIAHILFRLDVGGLENGVVNLINHMPGEAFRHMVVSLTEITDFRRRIVRDDVPCVALHKPPGHALWLYPRLFRLLREHRPAIVHTRNLAALEATVPAWAAGVPVRIHGEHGRAVVDNDASDGKYRLVRRLYSPFVTSYIALSRELEQYLRQRVGIGPRRVSRIYNGVDTERFHPAAGRQDIPGCPFSPAVHWLLGSVGRLQPVKDQPCLARAFVRALALAPQLRSRLRLVLVGEGPLHAEIEGILQAAGCRQLAWLPGNRTDVPEVLRGLDCFVLPSRSEGISNAILEAMASALPVIATDVGGNGELVTPGETGVLVPAGDPEALARQIVALALDPGRGRRLGEAGRLQAERRFSLAAMVDAYRQLYEEQLSRSGRPGRFPAGETTTTKLPGGNGRDVRNHWNF